MAEVEEIGPTQEEDACRRGRDGRGDVPTAIEQGPFAKCGTGPLGMKHLFSASNRRLADLHGTFCHEEEPLARLAFLKEHLTRLEGARRTLLRKPSELGGGKRAEVPDAPQQLGVRHAGAVSRLGCHGEDAHLSLARKGLEGITGRLSASALGRESEARCTSRCAARPQFSETAGTWSEGLKRDFQSPALLMLGCSRSWVRIGWLDLGKTGAVDLWVLPKQESSN